MGSELLIGDRIKAIRQSLGESQTEFGEHFSPPISKVTVSRWESGGVKPQKKRLREIAKLGNVSVNYLLNGVNLENAGELLENSPHDQKQINGTITELKLLLNNYRSDSNVKNKSRKEGLEDNLKVEAGIIVERGLTELDMSTIMLFFKLFNSVKEKSNSEVVEKKLQNLVAYLVEFDNGYLNYDEKESHSRMDNLLNDLK